MKTLITSIALLSGIVAFAQENPKKDTVKTQKIEEVTLIKKVFQKKADRLIYDVAASPIAKGTNAFDLLKETPLISTTDDKTLKIVGKNSAQIFINGRKSNMSADAVLEMLKGMPAENIQKIEVITMPSSEFAVEGNQGIVNIILKKKPTDGTSGNLRFENSQSYFNSQNASASVNYRKGKLGISTNLYGRANNRMQGLNLSNGFEKRTLDPKTGNFVEPFKNISTGNVQEPGKSTGGYFNLDYQLTDNQSLGFSYNKSYYWCNNLTSNFTNIFTDLNTNTSLISKTKNFGKSNEDNNSFNLNYELKTDDKGSKMSISTSYLNFRKKEEVNGSTLLLDNNFNELQMMKQFRQEIPMKVDNYGVLVDFVKKLKNDYTLNFGASFNNTKTDNETKYYNIIPPTGIDANQTNHFVYTENIPAVYTTLEKNFGEKWATKIGLRFENTNSKGTVIDKNIDINRNNNSFLPYLSVNYNPNQNHSFSYSFSSRIERPEFWAISPTKIYLTSTNYVQNNPFAKPQTYYNQEFMYMLKSAYFINLSHSLIKDASEQIPLQGIDKNGERVLAYIRTNYGDKQDMTASLGMQKQFFKGIWNANNSLFVGHSIYKGEVSGDPTDTKNQVSFTKNVIDYNTTYYGAQLNNTIRLSSKKDWFLGVNYFYTSALMIELGKLRPFQGLDLSVKKIWNDWTFNLAVKDVLHTSENIIEAYNANSSYNIVDQNQYRRRGVFTITYNFGNKKLQKARDFGGANDDIKKRTGN